MTERPIQMAPYDSNWPAQFEEARESLRRVFPPSLAVIEHVGSTAVPGLGAKPVIDIMVGVPQLSAVESRIAALENLGYQYVPEYEAQLPDRRYFRKPRQRPRTHHLHAVVRGSEFWIRHIVFREFLRTHPQAAREYYSLKCDLARLYGHNRTAYTEGKTEFIEWCLDQARSQGTR